VVIIDSRIFVAAIPCRAEAEDELKRLKIQGDRVTELLHSNLGLGTLRGCNKNGEQAECIAEEEHWG
jgi:hypothetical protein